MDKNCELVIASKNVHKIREYKYILKSFSKNIEVLSLLDFPNYTALEETLLTFRDRSVEKALLAAKFLGKYVLADDSGLVVPAINNEPGIVSANYAKKGATSSENRKKLLKKIEKTDKKERYAYFICCVSIASKNGIEKTAEAKCEGRVIDKEIGRNGFGYDSIFIKHDYNNTFAQLNETTKNLISHRRKALDKLKSTIESLF